MTRARLRTLIALAAFGLLAALLTAAATQRTSPPAAPSIPCKPASQMTPQQRAALFASLPPGGSGIRRCTPAGRSSHVPAAAGSSSSAIHTTAFSRPSELQHFQSKNYYTMSDVNLSDDYCDNRGVLADLYDQAGWEGYEFFNNQGCGHTAYWAGPLSFNDTAYGVKYVQVKLIACNSSSCSTAKWSSQHANPYWPGQGTKPVDSTFSFCNKDNAGHTLACFSAHL